MAVLETSARATSTWTLSDVPDDTETCTIGDKVYTFLDTLVNTDGRVHIGATVAATLDAFAIAINEGGAGSGAGTDFAAAMTANKYVTAVRVGSTLVITARQPGPEGNLIATDDTHGEGSWTSTVMAGGSGAGVNADLTVIRDQCQVNSEVWSLLNSLIGE